MKFYKGMIPWNIDKHRTYICSTCSKVFAPTSNGKPKYCSKECMKIGWKKIGFGKWHTGRHISEEHKEKLRISGKRKEVYGVLFKQDVREKAIKRSKEVLTGKPGWNRGGKAPWATGDKNYNWKGGVSTEIRKQRVMFKNSIQKEVLKRDDYTCRICHVKGGVLHVDHIQEWSEYVELRFDINNCRTLCQSCHYFITFKKPMNPKSISWGINNYSKKVG